MGKVKLTKEQAEAIERITTKSLAVGKHIETGWKTRRDLCLNELTTDELIKALYIGYEVEPEIKIGDFVDIGLFGLCKIAEVTGVKGKLIAINGSEEYHEFKINRVLTDEEKQEEKERRWWADHGREVWELKQKDILVKGNCESIVDHVGKDKVVLIKNGLKVVVKMFNIKKHYRVRYLAEDRKDVDHD